MVANGSAPKSNRFTFALPKSRISGIVSFFRRGEIWARMLICLVVIVIIWLGTGGWKPPFPYRTRYVPQRELVARVSFEYEDQRLTRERQAAAESRMLCVYRNDTSKIPLIRNASIEKLFGIVSAEEYSPNLWAEFHPLEADSADHEKTFRTFKTELSTHDPDLEKTKVAIAKTLEPFRHKGLLTKLQHEVFQGSSRSISVYQDDDLENRSSIPVSEVRILEVRDLLFEKLKEELNAQEVFNDVDLLAERIGFWIYSNFPETLKIDDEETRKVRDRVLSKVPVELKRYSVGDKLIYDESQKGPGQGIKAGVPLVESDIEVLRAEHQAYLESMTASHKTMYMLADFGLYAAVLLLCGSYMYFRERRVIRDIGRFCMIVALFGLTIIVCYQLEDRWQVELVPLTVFSMVISIAYRHEMAWVLGGCAALVSAYSLGMGLNHVVIFVSSLVTGSLLCTEISTRTKLFYVGLLMAVITFATTVGTGVLAGQAVTWNSMASNLLLLAAWNGFCAFLSALLITVLLPFIEKLFDVQTDLKLLEWSDPSHELLNKMIQRAPGTYNHSINVASIAEAAADSIGANGLLCRVGAYFHDVGKMLKPEYFVENQVSGENKHDSLVPAMSTLVIIAHVKDGVELARKHKLPTSMIDMIEQHHGTTLVKYFYDQALKEAEEKGEEVDESNFRYPGPKPQTKEACVMMLADTVESACRTLSEPAPARIESLIKEISAAKLNDGQFTECPLTLKELHTIEQSLTKSLISVYHSRIKYPEQNGNE